jgi:hypothetical protein
MKSKISILVLTFLFAYSVNARDFDWDCFMGVSGNFSFYKNQNSISLGMKDIGIWIGKETSFSLELNLVGFDWLTLDEYNKKNYNHSFLTEYNWVWFALMCIPTYIVTYGEGGQNMWFAYVFLGPSIVSNSQIGYSFFKTKTFSSNFLSSQIYFKSKLDYFDHNDIKFFRYKPEIGLELAHIFRGDRNSFGLFINIGYTYPIDFVSKKIVTNGFIPAISIKLGYGS